MRPAEPLPNDALETCVKNAWVVLHSNHTGAFYIELLPESVAASHEAFRNAAGEGYETIGVFDTYRKAHDALTSWIRLPGAERAREGKVL